MRVRNGWRTWVVASGAGLAVVGLIVALVKLAVGRQAGRGAEPILAAYHPEGAYRPLNVRYPPDGALFPPDIVPPTFLWEDSQSTVDTWLVRFQFADAPDELHFRTSATQWTPSAREWATLTRRSREKTAQVTVLGWRRREPGRILSRGRTSLRTSRDAVDAPLFYREVNLPFIEAVKDPTRIRWRFGSLGSAQSARVVLEGLPVCGNCHSFSADGATLGMDVDYANSKGSYAITRTARQMTLATSEIITWDDYKRDEGELTFGFLSQVSPDGRHVISTVKDRSVFVPRPDLAFSQLFFPIKGILAVYSRATRTFRALPGADDPQYVQSNPAWSPDGKYIVFARSRAYQLKGAVARNKVLLDPDECAEFLQGGKSFRYDLYRIPFNEGNGGVAEPLAGAANNEQSNYFPKYSPDGKWIVFCRAKSFMLLQPDSELYLIPASGGAARRLRCNTDRMNSWHSWSPNSRWLVFSSKANSPYTQLFLTHIDEQGESTPPVVLAHLTAPDRAANIPEFVNLGPDAIARIREQFVDDYSFARTAYNCESQGDIDRAIRNYEQALQLNPRNVPAHQRLGFLLYSARHQPNEGLAHTLEALRLDPDDGCAHFDLGMVYFEQGELDRAIQHLAAAVRLLPNGFEGRYNPPFMEFNLGKALLLKGDFASGAEHLKRAAQLRPNKGEIHHVLALALARQGLTEEAAAHYAQAIQIQPGLDQTPDLADLLAQNYAQMGRFPEAVTYAAKALQLARKSGNEGLANQILQRLEQYQTAR